MEETEKLSNDDFRNMFTTLKKYVETEMDQWELWKFDSKYGPIFVDVSMDPSGSDEAYISVNHLIDSD